VAFCVRTGKTRFERSLPRQATLRSYLGISCVLAPGPCSWISILLGVWCRDRPRMGFEGSAIQFLLRATCRLHFPGACRTGRSRRPGRGRTRWRRCLSRQAPQPARSISSHQVRCFSASGPGSAVTVPCQTSAPSQSSTQTAIFFREISGNCAKKVVAVGDCTRSRPSRPRSMVCGRNL
jgi:hypothetical protein